MSTLTPAAIAANLRIIRPHVRLTPVVDVHHDDLGPLPIVCKLEHLQHAGSFKSRGAFTHLLTRDVPPAGVVAASGGNHGAAVAYAAGQLGIPANIFVPESSSAAKIAVIRDHGATVHVGGAQYVDALARSTDWIAGTGAMAIHAYDAPETILGQGSVGTELLDQCEVDTVLVAVGGGGLIAGITAAIGGQARVVAVEPVTCHTLHAARAAGRPVDVPVSGVAANSLGAQRIGDHVWEIVKDGVTDSVLVDDDAIVSAQAWAWRHLRQVLEPGGATAMAALLSRTYVPQPDERLAVILCGANTDSLPA